MISDSNGFLIFFWFVKCLFHLTMCFNFKLTMQMDPSGIYNVYCENVNLTAISFDNCFIYKMLCNTTNLSSMFEFENKTIFLYSPILTMYSHTTNYANQLNWLPWNNWNVVKSWVKHHSLSLGYKLAKHHEQTLLLLQ